MGFETRKERERERERERGKGKGYDTKGNYGVPQERKRVSFEQLH